jgi:hypothetical protein
LDRSAAWAEALAWSLDTPAVREATALLAAAETTIVAPPIPDCLDALGPLFERMFAHGRPGRVELVLASLDGVPARRDCCARILSRFPALRVHVHDPARATWFAVPIDGLHVQLDDLLRESEMIVLAATVVGRDPDPLMRLLVPGLASPDVRAAVTRGAGDRAIGAEVASVLGIDLVIAFEANDGERVHVGTPEELTRVRSWS